MYKEYQIFFFVRNLPDFKQKTKSFTRNKHKLNYFRKHTHFTQPRKQKRKITHLQKYMQTYKKNFKSFTHKKAGSKLFLHIARYRKTDIHTPIREDWRHYRTETKFKINATLKKDIKHSHSQYLFYVVFYLNQPTTQPLVIHRLVYNTRNKNINTKL